MRFRALYCVALAATVLAGGCDSYKRAAAPIAPTTTSSVDRTTADAGRCSPPRVQYRPYRGKGEGLSQIPWIRGEPRDSGLVALLWYWPRDWQRQRVREARIFTGGVAPAGYNVKVMWVFLGHSARNRGGPELVVKGQRLDGPGGFRDSFAAIGYAGARGAPSFASTIDVPEPGCWRLSVSTRSLRAYVDFQAVDGDNSD